MVPAELLTLHKAAVNRYLDILGIRAAEQSSADIDVIAHQTDTVKDWMKNEPREGPEGSAERARSSVREEEGVATVKPASLTGFEVIDEFADFLRSPPASGRAQLVVLRKDLIEEGRRCARGGPGRWECT